MPARGVKNALVVVVDVGSHVTDRDAEISRILIGKFLQQPFLNAKKFEAALVVVGSDDTDNPINSSVGDYEHISVVQPLDIADSKEFAEAIASNVVPSKSSGDYVDALLVASQMFDERCTKGSWTRTIALISNGAGPTNATDEDVAKLKGHFEENETSVVFASVDPPSVASSKLPDGSPTRVKSELETIMTRIGAQVQHVSSIAETDVVTQPPPVSATTVFRGPLEISDGFKIYVYAYNAVSAVTPPSLKKMSIPATEDDADREGVVKMERSYFSLEDPNTAVPPEEHIKAYKYGSEFVPFNASDLIAFKWQSTKSLKTLGFIPRAHLKRDHFADKCVKLVPFPGDQVSEAGLSVLKQALINQDKVGVVRFVKRANDAPQLGALLPTSDVKENALMFMRLPFAEDLREFEFAEFDAKCPAPTQQQLDAAENLVLNSTLGDDWAPEAVKNPALQRLHNALQARAADPDADLDLDNSELNSALKHRVESALQRPKTIEALEAFKAEFSLVKNTGKAAVKKRSYWGDRDRDRSKAGGNDAGSSSGSSGSPGDIFALDLGLAGDEKKIKTDPGAFSFSAASFSDGGGADGTNADGSGALKPARIFRGMVDSAGGNASVINNAVAGLVQRVRDLLSEAPGAAKAEETDKESALECIKAYRKACVDGLCPVPAFNDYLRTFRDAYSVANNSGPQPAFAKFYTTLLEEKISLITKLEAVDGVTPAEGDTFLEDPHNKSSSAQSAEDDEDSEEDLFDLLT